MFLYVVFETGVVCWVCAYFEKQLQLSVSSAAWRLSVFWGGLIIGRMLPLFRPPGASNWPILIISLLICSVLLAVFGMIPTPTIATAVLLFAGIAAGPPWPLIATTAQAVRANRTFTSCVIAAGALGAAAGPAVSVWFISLFGLTQLFHCLAVIAMLTAISSEAARIYYKHQLRDTA